MPNQHGRPWIIITTTISIVIAAYLLSLAIVRTVVFQKAQMSTQSAVGEIQDRDEYRVLSTLLESEYDSLPDLYLIEDHTDLGLHDLDKSRPWKFEVSDEHWRDFVSKNQDPSKMGNGFALSQPYFLYNSEEMFTLGWKLRYARIESSAFLTYSRVGFNQAKDAALVHVVTQMPGRSLRPFVFAFGNWYLLIKSDGEWSIESWQETFIT